MRNSTSSSGHRKATTVKVTPKKAWKRKDVPAHALPFAKRFQELINSRWGGSTTALAKHISVSQSMVSKITNGRVPMDEAWLTGEPRSLHGGEVNKAKSAKRINILDALRLQGEEREEFKVAGLTALGPASLQEVVTKYRKELMLLRAQVGNR